MTNKDENMQDTIKLFFIGDNYYMASGTSMSPIYEEGTYKRWDWGFVTIALQQGKEIYIRQATKEEAKWAANELKRITGIK